MPAIDGTWEPNAQRSCEFMPFPHEGHVPETRRQLPPRTHDLLFLIREQGLSVPKEYRRLIGAIATASVPTRYPEDLKRVVRQYPYRRVSSYLTKSLKSSAGATQRTAGHPIVARNDPPWWQVVHVGTAL